MQSPVLSAMKSTDTSHTDFSPARTPESNKRRWTHTHVIAAMWSVVKEIHEKQVGAYSGPV